MTDLDSQDDGEQLANTQVPVGPGSQGFTLDRKDGHDSQPDENLLTTIGHQVKKICQEYISLARHVIDPWFADEKVRQVARHEAGHALLSYLSFGRIAAMVALNEFKGSVYHLIADQEREEDYFPEYHVLYELAGLASEESNSNQLIELIQTFRENKYSDLEFVREYISQQLGRLNIAEFERQTESFEQREQRIFDTMTEIATELETILHDGKLPFQKALAAITDELAKKQVMKGSMLSDRIRTILRNAGVTEQDEQAMRQALAQIDIDGIIDQHRPT